MSNIKANTDLPLVTIKMSTYNQEKYVRESVRGVLAQTYEPLQIVISDDHSTDSTWEIVQDEVNAYRKKGGIHKDILLNRNSENLGIVRHFQFISTLCKGEIIVCNAGDDISLPIRIERTVEAWLQAGGKEKVKLIHCDADRIDEHGKILRTPIQGRHAFNSLGACAAYTADVFTSFPLIDVPGLYEDAIFACRAMMLGTEIHIPERLVQYRAVGGISTSLLNYRESRERNLMAAINSYDYSSQELDDNRKRIGETRYLDLKARNARIRSELFRILTLHNGATMAIRFRNRGNIGFKWIWWALKGHLGNVITPFFVFLCIIPKWCGTPLLNRYVILLMRMGYPFKLG